MADNNKITTTIKDRANTIRLRTWTLTLAIVVTLVFYFLVTVSTKQEINPIDFIFLCLVQIITHCLYFPDGDLYGQKTKTFIDNKQAYNDRATEINQHKKIGQLREYCKIEFEERKKRYILNECGSIDITLDELNILKQLKEEEIKKLKCYEFKYKDKDTGKEKSKIVNFSKAKRKRLYNLIFKKLPIEPNYPETIMSAVENDGNSAIKDSSISYKAHSYIRKIFQAVVIGGIFAYIGYTVRDGIGIAEIVQILMYLTALFSTAVLGFSGGENCSKIYKSRFYVDLVNFIDSFNEWEIKNPVKAEDTLIEDVEEVEETADEIEEEIEKTDEKIE